MSKPLDILLVGELHEDIRAYDRYKKIIDSEEPDQIVGEGLAYSQEKTVEYMQLYTSSDFVAELFEKTKKLGYHFNELTFFRSYKYHFGFHQATLEYTDEFPEDIGIFTMNTEEAIQPSSEYSQDYTTALKSMLALPYEKVCEIQNDRYQSNELISWSLANSLSVYERDKAMVENLLSQEGRVLFGGGLVHTHNSIFTMYDRLKQESKFRKNLSVRRMKLIEADNL